jgi:hypothetical protein
MRKIGHRIPVTDAGIGKHKPVQPGSPVQGIIASASKQGIVTISAINRIIALTTVKVIIASVPG